MQDAKDSFYEMLRARLQVLNPERTISVRGVTRPGVVVDENEVQSTAVLPDCFHLRWIETSVNSQGAMPLCTQLCEVAYATAGSPEMGGLDRGRALAAMDGELMRAVCSEPQSVAKVSYSAVADGEATTTMTTQMWWSDPVVAPLKSGERLSRVVRVQVMSLLEGTEQ